LPVPGADLAGVLALRTLADADRLRRYLGDCRRLVVIGAGFIGFEVAAAARKRGVDVTVVEALPRAMTRAVSPVVSDYLTGLQRRNGARVLLGHGVRAVSGDGTVRGVQLTDARVLPADAVVAGIGVTPNVALAADAGLEVNDGVVVDRFLRTGDPAISAIGDCARFPRASDGQLVRLESVQNAVDQARSVAADICGAPAAYTAVPWFWSDQYASKLQIAGVTQPHDRTVVEGDPAQDRFSVFCYAGDRLLGVESVNRPVDFVTVRRQLAAADAAATALAHAA
jgi:3-phenylpropionate/trans-cinnamate dioxygenase ferredoxin reductase subunit